jgi:hypothetical protein
LSEATQIVAIKFPTKLYVCPSSTASSSHGH